MLRIEGISSPTSLIHFIAYEDGPFAFFIPSVQKMEVCYSSLEKCRRSTCSRTQKRSSEEYHAWIQNGLHDSLSSDLRRLTWTFEDSRSFCASQKLSAIGYLVYLLQAGMNHLSVQKISLSSMGMEVRSYIAFHQYRNVNNARILIFSSMSATGSYLASIHAHQRRRKIVAHFNSRGKTNLGKSSMRFAKRLTSSS